MKGTIKELEQKELQQVSGGTAEDTFHSPKCRSKDVQLVGPADIGTPPCFRCNACGYEWMLAL